MTACVFAGKLGVSVEAVQQGVEGLMFLLMESSKHTVSPTCAHSCTSEPNAEQML